MKAKLLILLSCFLLSIKAQTNLTIRVVFPFQPSEVTYMGFWPNITLPMLNTGPNEYAIATNVDGNGGLLFNIRYKLPVYDNQERWVAGGNAYTANLIPHRLDAHGIKNARVYVNNELLSNLYTTRNSENTGFDISLKVGPYGLISPNPIATRPHIPKDDRIPNEVPHHKAYRNLNYPNTSDINVLGWIVALADNELPDSCSVQVDYLRVYGFNGNDSVLLCQHNYESFSMANDGGLYIRFPFFPPGDASLPFPGTVSNGVLSFYPSGNRMKAWHLWTNRYASPQGFAFTGYKVVTRARILGHALVQVGIDFRNAAGVVHELGVSDWYFHKNGQWQLMSFDSRSIQTQTVMQQSPVFLQIKLEANTGEAQIEYSGLTKGQHLLEFFNAAGQLLCGHDFNVDNGSGRIQLQTYARTNTLIYKVTGPSGSKSGKVQLF